MSSYSLITFLYITALTVNSKDGHSPNYSTTLMPVLIAVAFITLAERKLLGIIQRQQVPLTQINPNTTLYKQKWSPQKQNTPKTDINKIWMCSANLYSMMIPYHVHCIRTWNNKSAIHHFSLFGWTRSNFVGKGLLYISNEWNVLTRNGQPNSNPYFCAAKCKTLKSLILCK